MLQQDYLLRMFLQLTTAIQNSLMRARGDKDPSSAALMLEESLEDATEIDGSLLLSLAPETMAAMLKLSQPDPVLMEYVSRTLLLSSQYHEEAGEQSQAALRRGQAYALAQSFGIQLSDESVSSEELDEFFKTTQQSQGLEQG